MLKCRLRDTTSPTDKPFRFMLVDFQYRLYFFAKEIHGSFYERKKDLHMVFIDLDKTYDRLMKILWWCWNRNIHVEYMNVIKEMYERISNSVRIITGDSKDSP